MWVNLPMLHSKTSTHAMHSGSNSRTLACVVASVDQRASEGSSEDVRSSVTKIRKNAASGVDADRRLPFIICDVVDTAKRWRRFQSCGSTFVARCLPPSRPIILYES